MARLLPDIITILLSSSAILLVLQAKYFDKYVQIGVLGCASLVIILNIITIVLELTGNHEKDVYRKLTIFSMIFAFGPLFGLIYGQVFAADPILKFIDWNTIPFGFYFFLSFNIILLLASTMRKIKNSLIMVISVPLVIFTVAAQLIVALYDLLFPPKLREFVPYIDVTRTMIYSFTEVLADEERLETERMLNSLGDVNEELGAGYHLRKGIGQGIDVGLTIVVFVFFGLVTVFNSLGIPPALVALLFSSLALALSTFAGLFGPFYGLAQYCKDYTLRHGNYRAASMYKIFEQLLSIPFNFASAGFLLLDLPPIDNETLEDFKDEMQEQLGEITNNISSLLGKDKSDVPKRTRKMIAKIMGSAENSLGTLDFRNIREDTARQFALTYFQHEFAWNPRSRKKAIKEFAASNHFDTLTGEQTLRNIGEKIILGQMDDDMVNNVMISAALKGIIMMEQKFQELLEDVELGQTCTGLAFGARQFLKDHYVVRSANEKLISRIKNFFTGVFAIPIVLVMSFHYWANRFFDVLSDYIEDGIMGGRAKDIVVIRYNEVFRGLLDIPSKMAKKRTESKARKLSSEEQAQRNWQVRRIIRRSANSVWEVIVFPFMVIYKMFYLIYKRLFVTEKHPREDFEKEVAHAALVSMYNELFQRLVMQSHVSSAY